MGAFCLLAVDNQSFFVMRDSADGFVEIRGGKNSLRITQSCAVYTH